MFISANAQSLSGEWKLVSAKKDGKKVVYQGEIKTNLNFSKENRMSGNSGCNRYSTTYVLKEAKTIEIEPIISTKMACLDEDLMKQENTFFGVISKTNKVKIKGNHLIFFDSEKENVLKFVRVS
jgi:heat shock protein HslJ